MSKFKNMAKNLRFLLGLVCSVSALCSSNFAYAYVTVPKISGAVKEEGTKELTKEQLIEEHKKNIEESIKESHDNYNELKSNPENSAILKDEYFDVTDDDFNLEKLKPEADKLYAAINEFINKSADCPVEDFNEYVIKYLCETGGGKIKTVSREEFEKDVPKAAQTSDRFRSRRGAPQQQEEPEKERKPGKIRLFRGINEMKYVKDFRDGKPYTGGTVRGYFFNDRSGSMVGHGTYTTPNKDYAEGFTDKRDKDGEVEGFGAVTEMCLDETKSKIISQVKLNLICNALAFYYPEFSRSITFKKSNFRKEFYDSYPFFIYEKAYENAFGEKLDNLITICVDKADGDSKEASNEFSRVSGRLVTEELPKYSEEFSREIVNLMKNEKKKPHFVSKVTAILDDPGLLANLLGYDVLRTADVYLIVNNSALTICRDGAEGKEEEVKSLEQLYDEFNKDKDKDKDKDNNNKGN